MKLYKWLLWNYCDYNIVAVLNETEEKEILIRFGKMAKTPGFYGKYYYFLNTRKRIISPSPTPALVIGSQYDELPLGKEMKMPFLNLQKYRMKVFCPRSDMSRELIMIFQVLGRKIRHRE